MSVFAMTSTPMAVSYPPAPEGSAFLALISETGGDAQYLVEITAYRGGENRSGGLWTLTEGPMVAVQGGVGSSAGQVELDYADRHWVGDPTDASKPNTYYEGRVTLPIRIDRSMPLLPEQARRVRRQFGTIEFANGDGSLDTIAKSYAVDGRTVRVLFGPYMAAYNEFRVIAEVVGEAWAPDNLTVRLSVRDRTYSLETPLQTNLYAGTGGAEGTSDVEGKPKPLLYGRCRNVTPTLVDPTNLVYQVHDGSVHAIDTVYDRGAELEFVEDVSGYAALIATTIPAGKFGTAIDSGLIRLGSTPDGLVTADVRGSDEPNYQNTLDVIAVRILEDKHGLSSTFVDEASFADAVTIAGELGIYIPSTEKPSTGEVISRLVASAGAWWGTGRTGKVKAGKLIAPESVQAVFTFDTHNILSLEPLTAPVPRWRQRVGYQKNWTPQGGDIAGAVTAARRQFLAEPFRVVSDANATTQVRHLQALDPDPLESLYENEADASSLATEQLTLHALDRRIFVIEVKRLAYQFDLGDVVSVEWPRLNLESGQNFVIIGITEDAATEIARLTLWG